jgi:uncharacterized protein YdeI (BOF family)
MNKLLLLSVLLLSFSWAVAQDTPSQSNPSQDQSTQQQTTPDQSGMNSSRGQSDTTSAQTSAGQNNMGNQTTVKGCLSSSNGNYMLTDKSGTMYQLMGDTSKLSEHVGHEIKVTGTMGSAGSQTGESGGGMGQGSQEALQVSSVKHISKNCQNGGSGSMSH